MRAARIGSWQAFTRQSCSTVASPLRRYSSQIGGRNWSTPLAKQLGEATAITGPIPISSYMRQCLTSPDGGYYTTAAKAGSAAAAADQDQFGKTGDFITSPEISQMFGELVGVWLLSEWMQQGQKKEGVVLIELGPGRGTLMSDVLRTLRQFETMARTIDTIYLVEASPSLREAQRKKLCGQNPLTEVDVGHQSRIEDLDINVVWVEDFSFIPKDASQSPFIIAHEFFDALPIHAFQSVKTTSAPPTPRPTSPPPSQWRELLVTPTPPPSILTPPAPNTPPGPDFELTLSKSSTPHSLYLPSTSQRYKNLLPRPDPSTIEISPESLALAASIAERIGGPNPSPSSSTSQPQPPSSRPSSGAALIIDYGPSSTVPSNSLRAIKSHVRLASPFMLPGQADISADVDFTALAEAALDASPGVEVHGPVEQGVWLEEMGIRERARVLASKAMVTDGAKKGEVEGAVDRLVGKAGRGGMGAVYKVLAIVPERGGKRPFGFFGGQAEQATV